MANIAVQRIKREFKEVLKSEEVRNELPDVPHISPGREGPSGGNPNIPGNPRLACFAAALCLWGSSSLPLLPPPSPPLPGPWGGRSRGRGVWGGIRFRGQMEKGRLSAGVSSRERPTAVATAGSVTRVGR